MADEPVVFPTKNPFTPKTVTVTGPSGRVYTMRELSAFDSMQADSVSVVAAEALYYRVGLALDTIDGEQLVPRPKKSFVDALLKTIPGGDSELLVEAYAKEFGLKTKEGTPPVGAADEIKNSPTPFA